LKPSSRRGADPAAQAVRAGRPRRAADADLLAVGPRAL